MGKVITRGKRPPVNEAYEHRILPIMDYQFAEQWGRALEVDPQVVMITQWNEWIAQRFIWDNGFGDLWGQAHRMTATPISWMCFQKEFNQGYRTHERRIYR